MYVLGNSLASERWWVKRLCLKVTDRDAITFGMELDDAVINAAQTLLKEQFPGMTGLQNTLYGSRLGFEALSVSSNSVQVIHDGM